MLDYNGKKPPNISAIKTAQINRLRGEKNHKLWLLPWED